MRKSEPALTDTPDDALRFGHPLGNLVYLIYVCAGLGWMTYLAIDLLVSGIHNGKSAPIATGLFGIFVLTIGMIVILVVFIRHPARLWPVIVLTSAELRLPESGWRHVPIGEIAGIGLAGREGKPGSQRFRWTPVFWRTDGRCVYVGGSGFSLLKKDGPAGTKQALFLTRLHRSISRLQGPSGQLASRAMQRAPHLSLSGTREQIWDPS